MARNNEEDSLGLEDLSGAVYPFVPKSNKKMTVGQFWSVPLLDGRWGCGRVLGFKLEGTTSFIAGVMDWVGDQPPTAEDVAQMACMVDQTNSNVKAFAYCHLQIDGWAELNNEIIPEHRRTDGIYRGSVKIRDTEPRTKVRYMSSVTLGGLFSIPQHKLTDLSKEEIDIGRTERFKDKV